MALVGLPGEARSARERGARGHRSYVYVVEYPVLSGTRVELAHARKLYAVCRGDREARAQSAAIETRRQSVQHDI